MAKYCGDYSQIVIARYCGYYAFMPSCGEVLWGLCLNKIVVAKYCGLQRIMPHQNSCGQVLWEYASTTSCSQVLCFMLQQRNLVFVLLLISCVGVCKPRRCIMFHLFFCVIVIPLLVLLFTTRT